MNVTRPLHEEPRASQAHTAQCKIGEVWTVWGWMVIRDGHGRLVLLVHRANADPEEDGGGHHRRKRETEGVVHEVELASSHIEHDGFLRALGLLGASSAVSRFA